MYNDLDNNKINRKILEEVNSNRTDGNRQNSILSTLDDKVGILSEVIKIYNNDIKLDILDYFIEKALLILSNNQKAELALKCIQNFFEPGSNFLNCNALEDNIAIGYILPLLTKTIIEYGDTQQKLELYQFIKNSDDKKMIFDELLELLDEIEIEIINDPNFHKACAQLIELEKLEHLKKNQNKNTKNNIESVAAIKHWDDGRIKEAKKSFKRVAKYNNKNKLLPSLAEYYLIKLSENKEEKNEHAKQFIINEQNMCFIEEYHETVENLSQQNPNEFNSLKENFRLYQMQCASNNSDLTTINSSINEVSSISH